MKSESMPTMPKSVTISEADNGYVVSMYDGRKENKMVCKDMKEAHQAVEKMMGGEKKGKKLRYGK